MEEADRPRELEELRGKPIKTINPATIPYTEMIDPQVSCNVPLVSVKMLTYNHAPYIAEAIEGVLRQETDFPIELVIGEDCSTDGTREIVFDYQRRHPEIIRVITSDKNVGMFPNSDRTERACCGKYVAYCEGDDYWHHPQKLQKQVAFLEAHPEYGLVHSDMDVRDVQTGLIVCRAHRAAGHSNDGEENLYVGILECKYVVWTCTVCARASIVRHVIDANPDELQNGRFLMGDTPRWLEMSRITRFHYIDEPLAVHNLLAESASRSRDSAKRLKFARSCREMSMHYTRKYDCPTKTRSAVISYYNKSVLLNAFMAMDRDAASEAYTELKGAGAQIALKEYLCYLGAHNRIVRQVLLNCARFRRLIRRIV